MRWRSSGAAHGQGRIGQRLGALIRAGVVVTCLVAVASLVAGCRTSGLLFTTNGSFRILSPHSSSTVKLPITIAWTANGVYRSGDSFAVFLDRGTIRPGQNVSSVLPDICKQNPSCSRQSYFQQVNVWITSQPSLKLNTLPESSLTGRSTGKEDHSVTVVILNNKGARVGEAFASADFVYLREGV
jgi:hypothetical protein